MGSWNRRSAALTAALAAVALLAGPVAATQAPAETTPLASIEGAIHDLENQIKNISIRLKYVSNPAAGPAPSGIEPKKKDKLAPPFLKCCSGNLDKMREKLQLVVDSMRLLHAGHAERQEQAGLDALSDMASALQVVNRNLEGLVASGDRRYADAALQAYGASVREFRARTQDYAVCCGRSGGDVKSKPKKKKKAREGDAPRG